MSGKLIVIEGVDSSGKETQAKRLVEKLKGENIPARMVSFPDYDSPSSSLVKMYLGGEFGNRPDAVSPYAASAFYAVDRYASFQTKWKQDLEDGTYIVCDRYVTSNMIHQAAKIKDAEQKKAFLEWLCDFEYQKLGLPLPDMVLFLDVPPEVGALLMAKRKNKITGEDQKDIHESNAAFLKESYQNAKYVAETFHFTSILCTKGETLRSIDDIGNEIFQHIREDLE